MIKLLTVFFWITYMLHPASAQSLILPPFEINNDTATLVTLPGNYWQIMEDRGSNLTIDRLNDPAKSNTFHFDSSHIKGIDYSVRTFWIRFILKNMLDQPLNIAFPNTNKASRSDFYILRPGATWTHQVTGLLYDYNKRDGLKDINLITLRINPGETIIIYNRISNNYYVNKPKAFTAGFGITDKILEKEHNAQIEAHKTDLLYEVFQGICFFGMVLNFLFFLIVRERIYLHYTIFLTYLFMYSYIWPNFIFASNLSFYHYLMILITSVGIITYIQFLRYFLQTFKKTPKWDLALNIVSILLAAETVVSFFIKPNISFSAYDWLGHAGDGLRFIGILMILTTLIFSRNRKDQPIGLLLLSGLPVAIWETLIAIPLAVWNYRAEHYGVQIPAWIQQIEKRYALINGLLMAWLALAFSWMLFKRFLNLQKQTASQELEKERLEKEKEMELRELVEEQKIVLEKTVKERTADLNHSLENLKSTQAQLIQSEKMASLGELTAGIAHEIQNPLNFVNNFSEVNKELLAEMKDEIDKGNLNEVKSIADDVINNQEKINQHGKRADAIVKGMLQHSRTSSGQKEPTDINALADEYLRLAFHGLRAKDKSFNAKCETDFDKSIGIINVVPQDIGRVILNLINNALYAVSEKKKLLSDGFEPEVKVTTKKLNARPDDPVGRGKVEIIVKDNGSGIPQHLLDKIFQPFFTTKPTGQGTGLGLSLAYDIVKAHGGELKVKTREVEGSEFIITLPAN